MYNLRRGVRSAVDRALVSPGRVNRYPVLVGRLLIFLLPVH